MAVEFLTMIFFFAGYIVEVCLSRFVAVATVISPVNCEPLPYNSGYPGYDYGYNPNVGCQCTKAAVAFAAFSWYQVYKLRLM